MDELPPIKSPKEFTGEGLEIIGDPTNPLETGALCFQDGKNPSILLPSRETLPQWTPDSAGEWRKAWRRKIAENLALRIRYHPADQEAKSELKAILKECREEIPRDRVTERCVKLVKTHGELRDRPLQNLRDKALIIALLEVAVDIASENKRPPTESEILDRVEILTDREGKRIFIYSERKHLADLLRSIGFAWLERRPRGYQGER